MWDVFFSYPRTDRVPALVLVSALRESGLTVWADEDDVRLFDSLSDRVAEGIASSMVLLAWYSSAYPQSRYCQWELTAGWLAAQVHGAPTERILAINPESGVDHIVPRHLRRILLPSPADADDVVRRVAARVGDLATPLGYANLRNRPTWFGDPPHASPRFRGRLDLLWQVHSALHDAADNAGRPGESPSGALVSGAGGMGKTQLAIEYAVRFADAFPGGVFWLRAHGNTGPDSGRRRASLVGQLRAFARQLDIGVELELDAIRAVLAGALQRQGKRCLWVVDDLPSGIEADELRQWLAPAQLARCLVTTRDRRLLAGLEEVAVDRLEINDARALLTSFEAPTTPDDSVALDQITAALGGFPLALDIAAASIRAIGFVDFATRLAEAQPEALALAADIAPQLPTGHEQSVSRTFDMSFRRLGKEAKWVLQVACVLAEAPIPPWLLRGALAAALSPDEVRRGIADARAESLLVRQPESGFCIHGLIAQSFAAWTPPQRVDAARQGAVGALLSHLDGEGQSIRSADWLRSWQPHAHALLDGNSVEQIDLAGRVAQAELAAGEFESAELTAVSAKEKVERLHRRHPLRVVCRDTLGTVLFARGLYDQALAELEDALGEALRIGTPPWARLRIRAKQAQVLGARGCCREQLEVLREVLAEARGVTDLQPSVVIAWQGLLGRALLDDGQVSHAVRVLTSAEAASRSGDPMNQTTLRIRLDLGMAFHADGQLQRAETEFRELAVDCERHLGSAHPATLECRNGLSAVRADLGIDSGEAADVANMVSERLGAEHPSAWTSQHNHAVGLLERGDLLGAEALLRHVYEQRRSHLGRDHHLTLLTAQLLGEALRLQGKLGEALPLHEQVVSRARAVLGPEHPQTLAARSSLGLALIASGGVDDGERELRLVMEFQRQRHGVLDVLTVETALSLVEVCRTHGRPPPSVARQIVGAFMMAPESELVPALRALRKQIR